MVSTRDFSAPPRPPSPAPEARDSTPLDREEIAALVEALIEEARRETRRRHRTYWALAALAAFVGLVILVLLDGGAASQTASPAGSARMTAAAETGTPMVAFDAGYVVGEHWHAEIYVVNADGVGDGT